MEGQGADTKTLKPGRYRVAKGIDRAMQQGGHGIQGRVTGHERWWGGGQRRLRATAVHSTPTAPRATSVGWYMRSAATRARDATYRGGHIGVGCDRRKLQGGGAGRMSGPIVRPKGGSTRKREKGASPDHRMGDDDGVARQAAVEPPSAPPRGWRTHQCHKWAPSPRG
jgi:hypothetical protein